MAKKTITVSGADVDLFHVAAAQYGDATQAYRIAQENNLADWLINGLMTLVIPGPIRIPSTGIPPQ